MIKNFNKDDLKAKERHGNTGAQSAKRQQAVLDKVMEELIARAPAKVKALLAEGKRREKQKVRKR